MASQYNEAGYFYDEQFRRYILQFMRLFGGFMIKTGRGRDDEEKFLKVPIRYSDMQRMVAHILKNNINIPHFLLSCAAANPAQPPKP